MGKRKGTYYQWFGFDGGKIKKDLTIQFILKQTNLSMV